MAEVALGDPEFKKLKSAQILCIHWKASHLALRGGLVFYGTYLEGLTKEA